MIYAVADLGSGTVKIVQAGHPHPLVIRKDGEVEYVGKGGIPIGLLPEVVFNQFEIRLEPGDRLLMYSDGFTECKLSDGQMLEEEGLKAMVRDCAQNRTDKKFLDELFVQVTQRMPPNSSMDDDVSATLFEFNGA